GVCEVGVCEVLAGRGCGRRGGSQIGEFAGDRGRTPQFGAALAEIGGKSEGGTLRSNEQAAIRRQRHPPLTGDLASLRFFDRDTRSKTHTPSRARDRSTRRPPREQGRRRERTTPARLLP